MNDEKKAEKLEKDASDSSSYVDEWMIPIGRTWEKHSRFNKYLCLTSFIFLSFLLIYSSEFTWYSSIGLLPFIIYWWNDIKCNQFLSKWKKERIPIHVNDEAVPKTGDMNLLKIAFSRRLLFFYGPQIIIFILEILIVAKYFN